MPRTSPATLDGSAAARDLHLTLITQHPPGDWRVPGVDLHVLPFRGGTGYFANAIEVKRILSTVRPDLLNAHYASGYGTTAGLVGYQPTLPVRLGQRRVRLPRPIGPYWVAPPA